MTINYQSIGKRIQILRKEHRLSQEKLAELIGVSVPHMSNIENGKTKFSLLVLMSVAEVLETETDYLLFGSADHLHPDASARKEKLKDIIAHYIDLQQEQGQQLVQDIKKLL